MVVRIRPPTCGLPVAILELVVYRDPTGCLTAFYFSPFEVRDDSNPSGDGLSHLSRIKLGGAATAGFFCPHLFLWGFFGCFLEHSIDHLVWCVGFSQLGWILRGRSRLLTWAQVTTLTNLPIVKRNTVVVETYPITISPLELTEQHPQLRLSGTHPSQNRSKVGVLILSIGQSILEIIKFLQQSRANITLNQSILRRTRTGFFKQVNPSMCII